jgi:peptidoglycan hydrolase CwlO-like protein
MKSFLLTFLLITILSCAAFFSTSIAFAADECPCTSDQDAQACNTAKIACLQPKIEEKKQAANTLSNTISVLNGQITLQELQIKQTKLQIDQLTKEIKDLSERISGLNVSLDQLTNVLIQRADATYKAQQANPLGVLLISDSVSGFFRKLKYLQVAQQHTTEIMKEAESQRLTFDQEKELKEKKQAEVEQKKQLLQKQENELTAQRANEQRLLTQTRNDEARYQQLLAQAQAELASFSSFTTSLGIGILPPQNSPDGWFFSQRDQRWASACIGNSCGTKNEGTILDVGCLVSSTAMIKKKFGEDVTPLTIAKNSSYFFSNTAYMLQPWPTPGGYSYVRTSFSQDRVDEELKNDRPVIVHLRINNRDGHFVVLKSGEKGNYTMHDPVEGYDKKFTDYYRIGQIDVLAYLRKS